MGTEPDGTEAVSPSPRGSEGGQKYHEKHKHIRGRGIISSSALGVADGLVTNLAFLTGFGGAVSSLELIRFAGLASMLAGAVSMFFGGVLSARSEEELYRADSDREAYEIENERDEEVWELKNLYLQKGLTEKEAEMVVERIASDKERFLEDMLATELHLHRTHLENPIKLGTVIGVSFLVGALVPLLPYYALTSRGVSAIASVALSLVFLMGVGAWKGRIARQSAWKSGLETVLIGTAAAAVLYLIGSAFVFV